MVMLSSRVMLSSQGVPRDGLSSDVRQFSGETEHGLRCCASTTSPLSSSLEESGDFLGGGWNPCIIAGFKLG